MREQITILLPTRSQEKQQRQQQRLAICITQYATTTTNIRKKENVRERAYNITNLTARLDP